MIGAQTPVTFEALIKRIDAILRRNGFASSQSSAIARVLAEAERDGAKSHGLHRLEVILRTVAAGKAKPRAVPKMAAGKGSAILRVDAAGGFSPAALDLGLPALVETANDLGLAALVVNDCAHVFALWPEVEELANAGLAGIALCPSYAVVAPAGGRHPVLGTNPLAFAWPRIGENPYVFDFATSVAARGEIEMKRQAKELLPEGWAVDDRGQATTDPQAALDGAMVAFGGYKGSAIATMIELLAGPMIGDLTSNETLGDLKSTDLAPTHGELIVAFSPQIFAGSRPGDPMERAEQVFEAILGSGARLPSGRRFQARARTLRDGIELTTEEAAMLRRLETDPLHDGD